MSAKPVTQADIDRQECDLDDSVKTLTNTALKLKRERDELFAAASDALYWLKGGEDGSPPSEDSIDEAKNRLRDALKDLSS